MMDIEAEREQVTRFDPEERTYCEWLLAEIEQLQSELDTFRWKPIEEPPKTNLFIFVLKHNRTIEDIWYAPQKAEALQTLCTYWMPIPPLPEPEGEGTNG